MINKLITITGILKDDYYITLQHLNHIRASIYLLHRSPQL